jgi:putative hydrolase of the HAD superfamily
MIQTLPKALLIDLDDTILVDSGNTADCWREACAACLPPPSACDPTALWEAIERTRQWFWAEPERHRVGRLDLDEARREVVRISLAELAADASGLAEKIASAYGVMREEKIQPFPGAVETIHWLRDHGCRLALLTNGDGAAQRKKVDRFRLGELFDLILIEGELGFGKPDPRIYQMALERLAVSAGETWMVGDNLEWEVVSPKRLGITCVWVDVRGVGLPHGHAAVPDRIIRNLSELRNLVYPGAGSRGELTVSAGDATE